MTIIIWQYICFCSVSSLLWLMHSSSLMKRANSLLWISFTYHDGALKNHWNVILVMPQLVHLFSKSLRNELQKDENNIFAPKKCAHVSDKNKTFGKKVFYFFLIPTKRKWRRKELKWTNSRLIWVKMITPSQHFVCQLLAFLMDSFHIDFLSSLIQQPKKTDGLHNIFLTGSNYFGQNQSGIGSV